MGAFYFDFRQSFVIQKCAEGINEKESKCKLGNLTPDAAAVGEQVFSGKIMQNILKNNYILLIEF